VTGDTGNPVRLKLKVVPGAGSAGIVGWLGPALKVRVTAPAEKGKANAAVTALLAAELGLPPAGLRPREILDDPGVRIYAEDWGRRSEIGVVAVVDDTNAGACWMRVLPEGVGLACPDGTTPQPGIALEPPYRHRGLGESLLREARGRAWRAAHQKVSLTVHLQNPAIPLYERRGFEKAGIRRGYHLIVVKWLPQSA